MSKCTLCVFICQLLSKGGSYCIVFYGGFLTLFPDPSSRVVLDISVEVIVKIQKSCFSAQESPIFTI